MEKDTGNWKEKSLGIKLSDEKKTCVSDLRFADDVLMMANSLKQFKNDLGLQKKKYRSAGTRNHPPKQYQNPNKPGNKQVERNRNRRDACRDTSSGRKSKVCGFITFVDQECALHRIRCAWSAFAEHRQELTSQSNSLRHQFDGVVTPTITYGAKTCATAKEHEKMLRTPLRTMLRLITQTKRKYKDTRDDEMSEDAQEERQHT